jgi:hypothetical protein
MNYVRYVYYDSNIHERRSICYIKDGTIVRNIIAVS